MLLDAAAIPSSVALDAVAEAFGVHENNRLILPVVAAWNGNDDLIPDADRITGSSALQLLSQVSPSTIPSLSSAVVDATVVSSGVKLRGASGSIGTGAQSALGSTVSAGPSLAVPDAPPRPVVGPDFTTGQLARGGPLLQHLGVLPESSLGAYLRDNPDAVATLLASPPAASDVMVWWNALGADRRAAVRQATPQLVGNLDGIPYGERDLANRTLLTHTMTQLRKTIASDAGRTVIDNAKQQLTMLESISRALGSTKAVPARTLMSLDVVGQGKAAIVLGDLRTADYVSYLVPGMFFTIENQLGDWVDAAARRSDEQLSWLRLFADQKADGAQDKTVATVAWIGYHTPNLTNVGGIQNADEGRDALASTITGLQSLRTGDEPYVSVIAHSYGSTAALMALTEYDFQIDALAMVGSPGSPAKSAAQLHVRNGNVYVGEAAWDPIPNSSYFGSDPGAPSYGAKPLGVAGTVDMITHAVLAASAGHNEYFSPGTESMRNFALIGIDKGEYVTHETSTPLAKSVARSSH
jgi:hypothetical protein